MTGPISSSNREHGTMFTRTTMFASAMVIPILGMAIPWAGSQAMAQDARAGTVVYRRCAACHTTTGRPSIGPPLNGVVGRTAGTVPRFAYSKAMAAGRIVWDRAALDRFLARPQGVVPGTKMGFAGISNPKDRQDLIAYLAGLPK